VNAPAAPIAPILFYDGGCGLCARAVQWCLRHDRRGELRFAPLQGATYAALVLPGKPQELDTLVLVEDGRLHVRSEAVVRLARHAGGIWWWLARAARVLPTGFRDAAYDAVARRRLRWFGTADACRAPDVAFRDRFLP
jgi:predicted DCC family thiol-disulfide oxidoreductase YuxK